MSQPNKVDLPLALLKKLLDELLHYEYRELSDTTLVPLIKLIDPDERFTHIEKTDDGKYHLWHKHLYLHSQERRSKVRAEMEKDRNLLQAREEFRSGVLIALSREFLPSDKRTAEFASLIVEKIMTGQSDLLAKALGIDVTQIPPLPGTFKRLKGTN